jgi:predicted NACHT family NTPase
VEKHGNSADFSRGEYVPECFPVYIELRRFKNEPVDLIQTLIQEFDACGLPDSQAFVLLCLSEGRLLLLFDGVDEVPTDKLDATIQCIADFADKYDQNRFITSCRTAFYKTFFQKFVDVELTAFDDGQIKTFVRNWFGSELDRENKSAENFISLLLSHEHRSTLELARTPLLLTFLCLVYDDSQRFPANRSSLYRRALMILMEKWAAEKRVHNAPIYADLHVELEMELLSEIAARAYIDDQLLFSEQYIVQQITNFMRATLNAPPRLDARKVLEAIQVQQGLLVERAADAYSFSHLTIQEYLTAEFFHRPGKLSELVEKHLFDERWREIFLLSAGMTGTDDLLLCMLKECQRLLQQDPIASRCVRWAMDIIPTTGTSLEDVALRIYVLSIPLRFKRYTEGRYERTEKPADDLLDVFLPNFLYGKRGPKNWSVRSARKWLNYFNKVVRMKSPLTIAEKLLVRSLKNTRP